MIHMHVSGHLIRDPQSRTTKAGGTFATALLATGDDLVVNIAAFDDDVSAVLLKCRKGDALSVSGKATIGVYTDREGATKPSVNVTANRVMTSGSEAAAKPRKRPDSRTDHRPGAPAGWSQQTDPAPFVDDVDLGF